MLRLMAMNAPLFADTKKAWRMVRLDQWIYASGHAAMAANGRAKASPLMRILLAVNDAERSVSVLRLTLVTPSLMRAFYVVR